MSITIEPPCGRSAVRTAPGSGRVGERTISSVQYHTGVATGAAHAGLGHRLGNVGPIRRGQQRAPEARAVDVPDRDDRYSFTTVTRTSGRTSGWILIPTWKSPSSRIGSDRSILRLSTLMPSSSSLRWMSLAVIEP